MRRGEGVRTGAGSPRRGRLAPASGTDGSGEWRRIHAAVRFLVEAHFP